jgi:hypothetical protein
MKAFSVHATHIISKDLLIRFNKITYQIVTRHPPRNLIGCEILTLEDEFLYAPS